MQIIRYSLLVFSNLAWVNLISAKERYWPQSNGDTTQPASSVKFEVPEDESWKLQILETIITFTPASNTRGTQSGGPTNMEYKFEYIQIIWKIVGDEPKLFVRIIYSNINYSYEEALNHPFCKSEIYAPASIDGNVDSSPVDTFLNELDKLDGLSDTVYGRSGDFIAWIRNFHNDDVSYTYAKSMYVDPNTGKSCDSSITIQLPLLADANFMSRDQFQRMKKKVEDITGMNLDNNAPPESKLLSPEKEGEGIEISSN